MCKCNQFIHVCTCTEYARSKICFGGEPFLNRKRKGNDFKIFFPHVKEEDFPGFFLFFSSFFRSGYLLTIVDFFLFFFMML